jgi:hypothetical protein
MKKEMLLCEAPFKVGKFAVTPLVRASYESLEIGGTVSFQASKHPVYVLVSSAGTNLLLDTAGNEIPIHQARLEFPDLESALPPELVPQAHQY